MTNDYAHYENANKEQQEDDVITSLSELLLQEAGTAPNGHDVKLSSLGSVLMSFIHGNDELYDIEPISGEEKEDAQKDLLQANSLEEASINAFHRNRQAIINEYFTNLYASFEKRKHAITTNPSGPIYGSLIDYLLLFVCILVVCIIICH